MLTYLSNMCIAEQLVQDFPEYSTPFLYMCRYYGLQLWFPEFFKRLELDCLVDEIINGTLPLQPDNCSNATSYQFYQDTLFTALATLPGNLLGVLLINIIGARVQLG